MKLEEFNFELPAERIACFPARQRDESKLMVVDRRSGEISHHHFKDIVELVSDKDFLVMNNSRVIPARLFGKIGEGVVDILVVKHLDTHTAEVLTLPARKCKPGVTITLGRDDDHLAAEVIAVGRRGRRTLHFNKPLEEVLSVGFAPLPPYLKRKYQYAELFREYDLARYQTLYSKVPGSIAAPTAGLHFSEDVLAKLKEKCEMIEITLDVGEATFQKIEVEDISQHRMGREIITIRMTDRQKIENLKKDKKLIAVGTTSVRSLETMALLQPGEERFESELFISPGFEFRLVDKMITNFHLPKSSLFILVSAFAGLELMQAAYRQAIEKEYRFFSYGDAMFIK